MIGMKLDTPPVGHVFTPAEARELARLAGDMTDAAVLLLVDRAARTIGEQLSRQLITATWIQSLDGFPDQIDLWRNPIQSVDKIEFLDEDEVWQELDLDEVYVDDLSEPARITPAGGGEWPTTAEQPGSVRITFTAGFGDEGSDVPEDLRGAVAMLASHYHENPQAVVAGSDARTFEIPLGVEDLIGPHRYAGEF